MPRSEASPGRTATHFRIIKRHRIARQPLSGIVHAVDRIENGCMIAKCGVVQWAGEPLAIVDGDTTWHNCLRIGTVQMMKQTQTNGGDNGAEEEQ